MNSTGISVFYGATDDQTAIAEFRLSVGSWVVTATFEVIRPLRLLNLGDLGVNSPGFRRRSVTAIGRFLPVRKGRYRPKADIHF